MENVKKMLLVEPDFIERLKRSENSVENSSSRLDGDMEKILKSKVNDREKWALYSQVLQRFLHIAESNRKPIKIPIVMDGVEHTIQENNYFDLKNMKKEENATNDSVKTDNLQELEGDFYGTPPDAAKSESSKQYSPSHTSILDKLPKQYSPSYIIDVIPKSYRTKSQTLLTHMIQSRPKIWWKESGEVVINNRTIPNSNILDLVGDVLRPLKRSKPVGWEDFATVLNDIKVPTSCIGNPTNLKFIKRLQSIDSNTSPASASAGTASVKEKNTSTPLSTKPLKQSNKKLDWERWTPY